MFIEYLDTPFADFNCSSGTPSMFTFNTSTLQAFYFIITGGYSNGDPFSTEDWVGIFNGDIVIIKNGKIDIIKCKGRDIDTLDLWRKCIRRKYFGNQEKHYNTIKHKVFVEEYLGDNLEDYKLDKYKRMEQLSRDIHLGNEFDKTLKMALPKGTTQEQVVTTTTKQKNLAQPRLKTSQGLFSLNAIQDKESGHMLLAIKTT